MRISIDYELLFVQIFLVFAGSAFIGIWGIGTLAQPMEIPTFKEGVVYTLNQESQLAAMQWLVHFGNIIKYFAWVVGIICYLGAICGMLGHVNRNPDGRERMSAPDLSKELNDLIDRIGHTEPTVDNILIFAFLEELRERRKKEEKE